MSIGGKMTKKKKDDATKKNVQPKKRRTSSLSSSFSSASSSSTAKRRECSRSNIGCGSYSNKRDTNLPIDVAFEQAMTIEDNGNVSDDRSVSLSVASEDAPVSSATQPQPVPVTPNSDSNNNDNGEKNHHHREDDDDDDYCDICFHGSTVEDTCADKSRPVSDFAKVLNGFAERIPKWLQLDRERKNRNNKNSRNNKNRANTNSNNEEGSCYSKLRWEYIQEHRRFMIDPSFCRYVFAVCAENYLQYGLPGGGPGDDDEDDANNALKHAKKFFLIHVLRLGILLRHSVIPSSEGRDAGWGSRLHQKCVVCSRDVLTNRGIVNCLACETPCDCVAREVQKQSAAARRRHPVTVPPQHSVVVAPQE